MTTNSSVQIGRPTESLRSSNSNVGDRSCSSSIPMPKQSSSASKPPKSYYTFGLNTPDGLFVSSPVPEDLEPPVYVPVPPSLSLSEMSNMYGATPSSSPTPNSFRLPSHPPSDAKHPHHSRGPSLKASSSTPLLNEIRMLEKGPTPSPTDSSPPVINGSPPAPSASEETMVSVAAPFPKRSIEKANMFMRQNWDHVLRLRTSLATLNAVVGVALMITMQEGNSLIYWLEGIFSYLCQCVCAL